MGFPTFDSLESFINLTTYDHLTEDELLFFSLADFLKILYSPSGFYRLQIKNHGNTYLFCVFQTKHI